MIPLTDSIARKSARSCLFPLSFLGMVRFGLVRFFKGFWRTPNRTIGSVHWLWWTLDRTIGSVQNGQVLVRKWSELRTGLKYRRRAFRGSATIFRAKWRWCEFEGRKPSIPVLVCHQKRALRKWCNCSWREATLMWIRRTEDFDPRSRMPLKTGLQKQCDCSWREATLM